MILADAKRMRVRFIDQNRGKGMGFVVGGIVINKQSLAFFGTKLFSMLSTIVTALLAFSPQETAPGSTMCTLDKVQITAIQALLAQRNTTCSYNVSLASILDAGH